VKVVVFADSQASSKARPRTDLVVQCRARTVGATAVSVPMKSVIARHFSLHLHAINYTVRTRSDPGIISPQQAEV